MAAVQKTDIGAVTLHRGFESSIFRQIPKLTEYGGARLGSHYQQAEAGFAPSAGA